MSLLFTRSQLQSTLRDLSPWIYAKVAALGLIVWLTNSGSLKHLIFVIQDRRLATAVIFFAVWALSLAALLVAAFLPSRRWRLFWAFLISTSTAAGYTYYQAQGGELAFFDVVAFWTARHEFSRAAAEYWSPMLRATAMFAACFAAIALPPVATSPAMRALLSKLSWVPVIPIILIVGIVFYREGKGTIGLPKQFTPLSLKVVLGITLNTGSSKARDQVGIEPGKSLSRAIVLFVDESIRADHISLEPGNPFTPELAKVGDRWIDFGPAVSGGNCSAIANAILRFMVNRRSVVRSARYNPTIWQYARAAGYRTVYIDAQAGFIKKFGNKLQNYMTVAETQLIDRLHRLDHSIPTWQLDDHLVDIVLEEMKAGDKVFILANKNGAHIPYQYGHPPEGHVIPFEQAVLEHVNNATTEGRRRASYLKTVRWSVDRGLARFTRDADLKDAAVIYTSDHGQNFAPGRLTHCSSGDRVDPAEALVPLLVTSGQPELARRFAKVAANSDRGASHFAVPATLLELMGYRSQDIDGLYDESLLRRIDGPPAFVAGDIFGLLSDVSEWHKVDPALVTKTRPTSVVIGP